MYTTFSMHIVNKVLKKSDGIGSCLIELQPFSLSEFQIAPIHCILMNSPSILVHRNSGFIQVVLDFFLVLMGFTAVKNTDCFSLLRLFIFTSQDQSTLNDGVHVVSVPDVVDVLGEVIR